MNASSKGLAHRSGLNWLLFPDPNWLCAPGANNYKEVAQEIQSLISEKNECYNDYREKSDRLHDLMTMQRNYQMAMPQPKRGHSHEQER